MRLPVALQPAPYRLSLASRPTHPEAYPIFKVGEAHRACREGRDQLLWRDRRQVIAGAATAAWPEPNVLRLRYTIEERDYLDQSRGELILPVSWKGSRTDNKRPFAACPLCGRVVDVLVFFGRWCCVSREHGLRHRSAQLTREVRWAENMAALDGEIAAGSAVGSSGRRHQALVARREDLRVKLGDRTATANVLQLAVYTREWVRPLIVPPHP